MIFPLTDQKEMIASCLLITPICPQYLRNNRSTRQKSLRCFPSCGPKGHIQGGFCGRSLKVQMTLMSPTNDPVDVNDYMFIAEIRPVLEPRISAQKTIKKADVLDKIRTRQDKEIGQREVFMGEVSVLHQRGREIELDLTFNGRNQSWDYSWRSNRWSGQQHVVDIIVLSYLNASEFAICSFFTTSSFMVLSSHKRAGVHHSAGQILMKNPPVDGNRNIASNADHELLEASHLLSNLGAGSGNGGDGASEVGNSASTSKGRAPRAQLYTAPVYSSAAARGADAQGNANNSKKRKLGNGAVDNGENVFDSGVEQEELLTLPAKKDIPYMLFSTRDDLVLPLRS